jgi:hypothetical protein
MPNVTMEEVAVQLCQYDACSCETAAEADFCDVWCEEHADEVDMGPCACGHAVCIAAFDPTGDPLGSVRGDTGS